MCEVCGPTTRAPERIRPDLLAQIRERNQQEAGRRGISLEEFQMANATVSLWHRIHGWWQGFRLNAQLLRPGL